MVQAPVQQVVQVVQQPEIRWEPMPMPLPPPSPPPMRMMTPPPPPMPEIKYVDKIVELPVEVTKYVEVEVPVEVIKVVEVERIVHKITKKIVEIPVTVERRVEVPVPYERIVHVEVPVERIVYRDVPVPVYSGEERVVTKEIQVAVEVTREIPVAVEHIVTKEVQVPVEIGFREETRVGDASTHKIVSIEHRRGTHMSPEHTRQDTRQAMPTQAMTMQGYSSVGTSNLYGYTQQMHQIQDGEQVTDTELSHTLDQIVNSQGNSWVKKLGRFASTDGAHWVTVDQIMAHMKQ